MMRYTFEIVQQWDDETLDCMLDMYRCEVYEARRWDYAVDERILHNYQIVKEEYERRFNK